MPQLIALALVGTAAYVGYKWLSKQYSQRDRDGVARARSRAEPQNLGELSWDEAEGVYRPPPQGLRYSLRADLSEVTAAAKAV